MNFYNPNPYGLYPQMQGYSQAMPDQLAQLRQQRQFPAAQQPQSGIIWVQGEAGAKAYMVAPGNTAVLMDSEGDSFYIKTVDAMGIPSLEIFDYKKRAENREEYLTRREFLEFQRSLRGEESSPKFLKEESENG